LVVALENEVSNRLSRLLDILEAIGFEDKEEVVIALNYLLYMRRPLLWVDGKTTYNKFTIDRYYDDVLHLTESGYFYLRELTLDLVYVQEAALSVNWDENRIPSSVDYAVASQRFQVLRLFLEELAMQDYKQTKSLIKYLANKGRRYSFKPFLFINRIMASVGRSALNILMSRVDDSGKSQSDSQTKHAILEELKQWQSMITIWLNKEKEITKSSKAKEGMPNRKLEQLREDYQVRLMLK